MTSFWQKVKGTVTAGALAGPQTVGAGLRVVGGDIRPDEFDDVVVESLENSYDLGATGQFETGGEVRRAGDFPQFMADTHRDNPITGPFTGAAIDIVKGGHGLLAGGADLAGGVGDLAGSTGETLQLVGDGVSGVADANRATSGLLLPGALVGLVVVLVIVAVMVLKNPDTRAVVTRLRK